jgi:hypothetical protein
MQSSPIAQSIACTGAQIRRYEPSTSPLSADDANAAATAQRMPDAERIVIFLVI